MKILKLLALAGTASATLPVFLSAPVLANSPTQMLAQSSSVDRQYLDSLYTFLGDTDELAYNLAVDEMGAADNIGAAQAFCEAFGLGVTPSEAIDIYISSAAEEADKLELDSEEIGYSVGLYGGAVMNIGSAYYCPEFQPQVLRALRGL